MSESSESAYSNPASQQEFLRVFLASEREILRYVCVLVPSIADAQEIVQQTAMVLWEKFEDYDRSKPFTPWACRFALNVSRQWMDRHRRWRALLENGLAEDLSLRREQLQAEFDERLVHLNHCMKKLSRDQRGLIEGYYFNQTGVQSLADQTCRTTDAVYKSLQRIRKQLRSCIEKSIRNRQPSPGEQAT